MTGGAESVNSNNELVSLVGRLNDYMARLVTINMSQEEILDRQLKLAKDANRLS